jgi:hypothetical protein
MMCLRPPQPTWTLTLHWLTLMTFEPADKHALGHLPVICLADELGEVSVLALKFI